MVALKPTQVSIEPIPELSPPLTKRPPPTTILKYPQSCQPMKIDHVENGHEGQKLVQECRMTFIPFERNKGKGTTLKTYGGPKTYSSVYRTYSRIVSSIDKETSSNFCT